MPTRPPRDDSTVSGTIGTTAPTPPWTIELQLDQAVVSFERARRASDNVARRIALAIALEPDPATAAAAAAAAGMPLASLASLASLAPDPVINPPPRDVTTLAWERETISDRLAEFGPSWTPRGTYARLTRGVGDHDVRVKAHSFSVHLEIRSSNAPEVFRGYECYVPRARLNGPGTHYALNVSLAVHHLDQLTRKLRELAAVPAAPMMTATRRPRAAAGLGTRRRFGVEIEFYCSLSGPEILGRLNEAGVTAINGSSRRDDTENWQLKGDGSLRANGHELASPPLAGEEGLEAVALALRALRDMGARVNRTCGLHVHHEVRDLRARGLARFAEIWSQHQELIDWLVSPSRRGMASQYCSPLTEREVDSIRSSADAGQNLRAPRYRAVNVQAYIQHGTVEVRQHQGTLDFRKVEAWVKLTQGLLDEARAAEIPAPAASLRALLTRARVDEDAAAYLLGRAMHFGADADQLGLADRVPAGASA